MTILTAEQVAGVVNSSGGPPSGTTTAQWVSVARRESGFNTDVEDFLKSGHIGLWQIGSREHFQKYGSNYGTEAQFKSVLKSPLVNWFVARQLYMASGWAPWRASGGTPVPSSADTRAAANPDSSIGNAGGGDLGGAIPVGVGSVIKDLNPMDDVVAFLKTITDPLLKFAEWVGNPHNWIRVVQVGAGIALGVVAVSIVLRPVIDDASSTIKKGLL